MLKILWTVTSIILLSACASSSPPPYAFSPPADTQSHFYTAGSGATLSAARVDALEQLANRLLVSIQSRTQVSREKTADGDITQNYQSNSRLTSELLSFTNPTLVKDNRVGKQHFVLLKIEKSSVLEPINNYLLTSVKPLINTRNNKEQALINALLLWPRLPLVERYISLLQQYNYDHHDIGSGLARLKASFSELLAVTKVNIVIGDQSDELGIEQFLREQYQALSVDKVESQYVIDLMVMGPTIVKYSDTGITAMQVTAELVMLLNGKLVQQQPISIYQVGLDEQKVWTQVQQRFFEHLSFNKLN